MGKIRFLLICDGDVFDMSDVVIDAQWQGRRGSAARQLTVTLLDDDGYGRSRPLIYIDKGCQCLFYWEEAELFQGIILRHGQSEKKKVTLTAYDNGIYLANNKDSWYFTDRTASEIFTDVCSRFGIPCGEVADTEHRINDLPKSKTTGWDVICDALEQTYKATGTRYYPMCVHDELRLIRRRENVLQWVIETGQNVMGYTKITSLEKTKTRIKLYSEDDTVVASSVNTALEGRIGVFQDVDQPDDGLNAAQVQRMADTMVRENGRAQQDLSVSCLGIADVITGVGVYVSIPHVDALGSYYVENDVHTFDGSHHTMELDLVPVTDG